MMLVLVVAGCVPQDARPVPDLEGSLVLAATAADDYSAGALAVLPVGADAPSDLTTLHGDAVLAVDGSVVYAVNRLGMDTLRRYDALDAAPTWEISTERGSNPHAVARVGDRLLVTRYESPEAWILDAATGDRLDTVDLASLADDDGLPEASAAIPDGERALVALQRLRRRDGWSAAPEGHVVVVDLEAGTVEDVLAVGPNPVLVPHPAGGGLVATDEGLFRVRASGEVEGPAEVLDEGEAVGALTVAPDGSVFVVARGAPTLADHRLICLDGWSGAVVGQTPPIAAYLSDVAVLGDTIYVAARRGWDDPERFAGGLMTLPRATCDALPPPETWLHSTFAPFDLAIRP